MTKTILKKVAGRAAGKVASRYVGEGATLDPRRGWALLKDRNVAASQKLLALGMGVALTAILVAAELPLEVIVGFFLPFVGMGVDMLIDGAEMIIGPILFATLLLPHLVASAKQKERIPVETSPENILPPRYHR